jgi:hypothetical protein
MRRLLVALALVLVGLASLARIVVLTSPEHRRGEDQTYLTLPEWFLVHSPAEYAAFLTHDDPHRFPLLDHVGQLWSSYAAVIDATRKYPINTEYHVMINVIAISTTVEYGLKSLYEGTFGRLAASARGAHRTPEDDFAAATAQRYVDFIRDRPWYEFDFVAELKDLWSNVPVTGGNPIRKLERRFALTSELLVKSLYGKAIELGTRSSFERPKPVTAVVVDRKPQDGVELPELVVLQAFSDGMAMVTVPRYERFTPHAQGLARQGVRFVEVAGNRDVIVASLLTSDAALPRWGQRKLFEQPYLTRPGWRRVVVEVPIERLHEAVLAETPTLRLEHIYDF